MHVRLNPPHLTDDLVAHLRGAGCVAVKLDRRTIEAHPLQRVSDRHDRLKLSCELDTWRTLHTDIEVQIAW